MKVNKAEAVALLVALGFNKATEWDDKKLQERLEQVPDKVKEEDVPEEHKALYQSLVDTSEDERIELEGGEEPKEEKKSSKKKASKKVEAEGAIDVSEMSMADLRSLVEERKLKVKSSEMKNLEVLRVAVKKALKAAPKTSRVDKEVDKAAKKAKGNKVVPMKDEDEGEEDDEQNDDPDKASGREVDKFGSAIGSIRSKVNLALTEEWQSDEDIAEAAGVTLKQARSRLRRATRKGLCEVNRSISYRLPEGK